MAFTYDLATPVGQVRLLAGDDDAGALAATGGERTRTDEEVTALLAACGGEPSLAAALLLEGKAAQFAALATYTFDGTTERDYRQRSTRLLEAAAALRAGTGGIGFNAPANPGPFTGALEDD